VIYFIQDNGNLLIKIGFTYKGAEVRKRDGETWCPLRLTILATMDGDKAAEDALHKRFAAARVNDEREWFRPVPELIRFIIEREKLKALPPPTPASCYHFERCESGQGIPITDFFHEEDIPPPPFKEYEQPGCWTQTYSFGCPVC